MEEEKQHNPKLKLCPFCRGHSEVVKIKRDGVVGYAGRCAKCGATGAIVYKQPWHDSSFVTQCIAARKWNQRA